MMSSTLNGKIMFFMNLIMSGWNSTILIFFLNLSSNFRRLKLFCPSACLMFPEGMMKVILVSSKKQSLTGTPVICVNIDMILMSSLSNSILLMDNQSLFLDAKHGNRKRLSAYDAQFGISVVKLCYVSAAKGSQKLNFLFNILWHVLCKEELIEFL